MDRSWSSQLDFFRGTLAPFSRASESPMAIACLRLSTFPPFPPFPDRRVPFFLRCIALFTDLLAARPYLGIVVLFSRGTLDGGSHYSENTEASSVFDEAP
jgi:hypothetical protein